MITCPVRAALTARVPELANGSVEIIAVAREPGLLAKVAVRSRVRGINAVAVCIGWGGLRIADVEKRLCGEHVSIIAYDSDTARYVINALGIKSAIAEVINPEQRRIRVYVNPDDYARALGKVGHNLRLVRQLTSCSIHIRTATGANRAPHGCTTRQLPPIPVTERQPNERKHPV